jgi:AraC-like DNA-binding protein
MFRPEVSAVASLVDSADLLPANSTSISAGPSTGTGELPYRFHLETTDLDEARDFMTRVYGPARISTPDKIALVRLSGLATGPLRLIQSDLRMDLDYHAAPADRVLIGYVVAGVLRRQTAGQAAVFGPGDVALLKQPGQAYSGRSESALIRTVSFGGSLLDQVADELPNRAPAPVRFTSMTASSTAAAQRLRATLDFAWELMAGPRAASDQPLVTSSAARLLVATVLSTFPNTAATEPARGDHHDAGPATLDRAIKFIAENAGADLSAADIAAAAGVSIRAVQLAFRRELGVTPLGYLRQVRLDRAHRDLLAAGPAGPTVTAVSVRWGFSSSSRFAAYYREAFGVLPSHTRKLAG